jgi:hypothetical protein
MALEGKELAEKFLDDIRARTGETREELVKRIVEEVREIEKIDYAQRPKIVCLCGSTRFYDAFQRANYAETMAGRIVLSVGHSPQNAEQAHGESVGCTPEQKVALDELHKRKIDLADEILVLNVGGYIGSSTRGEIEYAERHSKPIRYAEPSEPEPKE